MGLPVEPGNLQSERQARWEAEWNSGMSLGLSLPEICKRLETHFVAQVAGVLREVADESEPEQDAGMPPSRLMYGGDLFEIRAQEGAFDSDRLTVVVGGVGTRWEPADFRAEEAPVEGSGRFTAIMVKADPRLRPVLEEMTSAVQCYFQDGYRYLEVHAMGELLTLEHQLTTALYMQLRTKLPEELVSQVWLYALTGDGQALYMLDPLAIQDALSASRAARPSTAESPITLTALLATGRVKEEDTVARRALVSEDPTKVRLQDLRYTTTPGYDLAETGVYGPEGWVQPLVGEGQLKLLAGYPADLRPELQPVLKQLRPRLATVVSDHAGSVRRILGRRDRGDFWSADRIMELMGHFFGAAADSYTK